jgi:hypothetical protein
MQYYNIINEYQVVLYRDSYRRDFERLPHEPYKKTFRKMITCLSFFE